MSLTRIGIDLGTTYSACGIYKSDRVEIITDNLGKRIFESVIYVDKAQEKIVVGSGCKHDVHKYKQVIYDSKRFIGLKYDNKRFQNDMQRWPFKANVINDKNTPKVRTEYWNEKNEKLWTAEEISAEILKAIHDRCCESVGISKNTALEAVITVPAYFNSTKRDKTRIAAEMANLKVIQIINEPSAAALAYAHQIIHQNAASNDCKYILVYDFGGGTFDVSIIRVLLNYQNPEIDVLATEGDPHLGGEDVDEAMVEEYKKRYKKETGKEMNEKNVIKLRKACEEAKKILSLKGNLNANVVLDILEDNDVNEELSLPDFNNITSEIIERTITLTKKVYEEVKSKIPKLDYILLVGGSSPIQSVRKRLQEEFPGTEIMSDIGAQEAVAYGATILANEKKFSNLKFNDIITKNIYTMIYDEKRNDNIYHCLIEKNTPIKNVNYEFMFKNGDDDQDHMDADLYEGDIEENEIDLIGFEPVPITKRKRGECEVTFHVTCNKSGIYQIETKEKIKDGSVVTRNIIIEHI